MIYFEMLKIVRIWQCAEMLIFVSASTNSYNKRLSMCMFN